MEQRLNIVIKTDDNHQAYEIWNACFRNLKSKQRVSTEVVYLEEEADKINSLEIDFDLRDFDMIARIINSLVILGVVGRETTLEKDKPEED